MIKTGSRLRIRDIESIPVFDERLLKIARTRRDGHVVTLSVISGLLSTVLLWSESSFTLWLGPGIVFGLFVMLPWCLWCRLPWQQTVASLVLAPAGYMAAVYVAVAEAPMLAGLVGSTILFAPLIFFCHARIRSALCSAGAAGWLLGILCAIPYLAYFGGIACWQIGVAVFLSSALHVDDA